MEYMLVELTKNSLIKKMVAILLIVVLTMFNFILLGTEMVSYAADVLDAETATNNKNVTFDIYFKNSNGTINSETEEKISNNDIKMYGRVSVKNDGYFLGSISLESGNFNFKNEILSGAINKIEGNTITLNQINSGETAEFEIGIEPVRNETINSGLLDMSSVIAINGIYRNIKEKDINISDKREVKLTLANPYDENSGLVLNGSVLSNSTFKINKIDKKIIQVLVESGLEGNGYPIKENNIELSVPEKVEKVEVNSRGTLSSNGKYETEFNENNWEYNKEEQKVSISIKNEEENNSIKWLKDGKDIIVVTYILDDNTELEDKLITVNDSITMYDTKATVKSGTVKIDLSEETDGIITTGIELADKSIYKGKLYSGENKEYKVKNNIYVNNGETDKTVSVELLPAKYETPAGDIMANAQFASTVLDKEDVLRLLGEDGALKILSTDGQVLSEISKDTETDENGKIIVNYQEGITTLKVETTRPIASGTIVLNNTKLIKQDSNSRAVKETYTALKEAMTNVEEKIELKETESKVKLQLNRTSLSTLTENVGVEITGTLITNNEANDLYSNANLKFVLPSQVEGVTNVIANLLYEDELNSSDPIVIDENGHKAIVVNLTGQQTKYKEGNIEGATVIIKANLLLNKKATNSNEAVKMICSNANTGDNVEAEQPIEVVSPRGMVTINSINDYGMSVIGEEDTQTSKLELGASAKESQVNIEIINNNEETIKDVKVLGDFPTQNETNTIKTSVGTIEVSDANAEVFYSEKENATDDLNDSSNGWSKELTNSSSVKKYLIKMDSMEQSQDLSASYKLNIPEGLQYNEQAYEGYKVTYNNTNTTGEVAATKLGLSTGKGPELKASIKAKLGNKDITNGGEVSQGEVVKYEIDIENTGTETATDVKVSSKLPDGLLLVKPKEDYIYSDGYYDELPDVKEATFDIESLAAGEKTTKSYEAKITKNINAGTEIESKATVKYGEATVETDAIKNKVKAGNLSVTIKRATDLSVENYRGEYVEYFVIVENISNETQKDVSVNIKLPEELEITNTSIVTDEGRNNIDFSNNTIQLGDINGGESKYVYIATEIKGLKNTDSKVIGISATAKSKDSDEVESNIYEEDIKDFILKVSMSANNENGYIKTDDVVEYTIKIENVSNVDSTRINIVDAIPEQLTIQSAVIDGVAPEEEIETNEVTLFANVGAHKSVEAKIKAVVNYDEERTEPVTITNKATLNEADNVLATSEEVSHIIQADSRSSEKGGEVSSKNLISGTAWLDENQDGKKDSDEKLLDGITVKLIDTAGNVVKDEEGKEFTTVTNSNGFYMLSNVSKGQYMIVFDYDTSVYAITAYKKAGVPDSKNSDAVLKQITINGEQGNYGVTDAITMDEEGISNIDIGLMTSTKFDLELNKYISKIIVQTKKETKTYNYDKATLAKAEIAAKQLQGSNVIIEYQIEVKNTGEVAGYVKSIVDYMPSSLKFSSELNKDWYQSGANLYNTSLANTKLEAGETKTIPLTLTKSMTEENTGLFNNKAEIANSYNEAGIPDIDSVAGNKVQKEDDMGSADVIIGVKTGAMVTYVSLTISIIMLIGVGAYFVNKKINKDTDIEVNF